MYTLGIPKRDYRRATRVLDYESQPTIPYHANLQDDGFYLFTFPEAGDEDDFRTIVIKLKGEGVRVIGADAQLTERQIMKLIDLVPLKEESTGAFGATSEELADMYSLKMLQKFRDEVMMDMEQQAEPEGGPIADMYGGQLDGLDKAIAIKRGETKDVPYDVAIGRMSRDEFEKSSKFGKMQERTPTVFTDKDLDDLRDIVLKYVEDPDDAEAEVQRFDDGGFDNMSDMVTTNLLRDPEYKKWYNNIHSIKESNNMRKVIRKIIREQNFDQRLAKAMGMSDDEFQDKVASRDVSGESMSNADIGALQKLVGNYSLEKILKTIAIIADRGGKNDEAFEIENFLKTFNKE